MFSEGATPFTFSTRMVSLTDPSEMYPMAFLSAATADSTVPVLVCWTAVEAVLYTFLPALSFSSRKCVPSVTTLSNASRVPLPCSRTTTVMFFSLLFPQETSAAPPRHIRPASAAETIFLIPFFIFSQTPFAFFFIFPDYGTSIARFAK